MKGRRVIAIMILAQILSAPVCMAMGKSEQPTADASETGTVTTETAAGGDEDVAARLEMLQFMDMLEHFELIKDLDVLEGGGE